MSFALTILSAIFVQMPIFAQSICSAPGSHVGKIRVEFLQKPISLKADIGAEAVKIPLVGQLQTASEEVKGYYKQALAFHYSFNYVEAIRSMNMAIRQNPGFVLGYLLLARDYMKIGGLANARLAVTRAREVAKNETLTDLEKAWLGAVGDYVENRRSIQISVGQLLNIGIADAEVLSFYSDIARYQEPVLKKILEINPDHLGAHHYLAHYYENRGQYALAQTHSRNALKYASKSWHLVHMLGHTLPMTNDWAGAAKQFQESDRLSREWMKEEDATLTDDWHYAHNLELYGFVEAKLGNLGKAEQLFKDMCAVPSPEENCVALVQFYVTQRRAADAFKVLNEKLWVTVLSPALRSPSDRVVYNLYGETLLLQGKKEEAVKISNQLIETENDFELLSTVLPFTLEFQEKNRVTPSRQNAIAEAIRESLAGYGFDIWSRGELSSAERVARAAKANGYNALADRIAQIIRRIDPAFSF